MNALAALAVSAMMIAVPAAAQIRVANPASDGLRQLGDIPRRAALRRAVLDAGSYCKRVERAGQQGRYRNLAYWRAQCDVKDKRLDYAVFIGPDGSVQVRPCQDLAGLKMPLCQTFPPRPAGTGRSRP